MNPPRVRLGDLTVGFVHGLAAALARSGQDSQALLDQFGLDKRRLAEAQGRLSIPRFMRLGHAAIQLSGDAALGLEMGRCGNLAHLGLAGVTAAQAPTVREAARTLVRFEPLYTQNYRGQSSFHEDPGGAWLRFYSISPYNTYNRFVVDSVLAGWHQYLRQLSGEPWVPRDVHIEYAPPPEISRYEQTFGCAVAFSADSNQLRIDQATLALPARDHCPSTWQQLLSLCERELEQRTRTRSLRERVTQLLGPLLHGREPDLEDIATRLHMPAWTLRRRLAEEGTHYRTLLNETRRDLAVAYIRDTELAFGEMAYLLGFASAEAFQRAFKRWTGQTPGEFRRNHRQQASAET